MAGWLLGLFSCRVMGGNESRGGCVCKVEPFDGYLVIPRMTEVPMTLIQLKAASLYRCNRQN